MTGRRTAALLQPNVKFLDQMRVFQKLADLTAHKWRHLPHRRMAKSLSAAATTTTTTNDYDVCIIGGGIVGCSIAYHLAADEAGKNCTVCVVERDSTVRDHNHSLFLDAKLINFSICLASTVGAPQFCPSEASASSTPWRRTSGCRCTEPSSWRRRASCCTWRAAKRRTSTSNPTDTSSWPATRKQRRFCNGTTRPRRAYKFRRFEKC